MLGNPKAVFGDPIKGFGIFRDYSKRWVSAQTGYGADKMTKVHPVLSAEQRIVETHTRYLAQLTDKLLRRHGKNIVEKQFATKRMALVIIDLYVLSCVLSRVTQSIEMNGQDAASGEIEIAKTFGFQVDERIRLVAQRMDSNEDEPLKSIADQAIEKEKFSWDNI
jgi:acyl-CoA dehydrogenase family protein 9